MGGKAKSRSTAQVTFSVDAGTLQALGELAEANADGNRSVVLRHLIAIAYLRPEVMGLRPACAGAQKGADDHRRRPASSIG